jgi:surface antigen/peptidoglycan hydrolase CwlO-like protein
MKKINIRKSIIILIAIIISISVPLQMTDQLVSADRFDDQISVLEEDIESYQQQIADLNSQVKTLQSALAVLDAEKAQIQTQIDINQAKYDKLVVNIAETEKQISDNKDALGVTIANLYVGDNTTPVEILFGSNSISDYMDKQEYRKSVRDQLLVTISKIKELKNQLEMQKIEINEVLTQQKLQRDELIKKGTEKQVLIDKTNGQESAYAQLVAQTAIELVNLREQQRIELDRLTGGGRNTSGAVGDFQYRNFSGVQGACGGGYPSYVEQPYAWDQNNSWGCSKGLDDGVDKWQLFNRECVSYAAWAAYSRFGKKVIGFGGNGHAYQWPNTASVYMQADVDNNPSVGSIAIAPDVGPVGHAMVVEHVYGDGWVRVSQYNFPADGQYSTMDIKVSGAVYIHFQDR